MGTWGTAVFADDTACDIRDQYRQWIEDGVDDAEALRATLDTFRSSFDDPESAGLCLLALALTQSKIGRLDPEIRARALTVLDQGGDLAVWETDNPKAAPRRRAALEKARAQLLGPQPARKRLRPPRRLACGLTAGDGLVLEVPTGLALLRVVRIKTHRLGETPLLEALRFQGFALPSQSTLDQLVPDASSGIALGNEPCFEAFVAYDKIDWVKAGFTKAVSFAPRPGDHEMQTCSGVAWSAIAQHLRDGASG